ncbi:CRISPR-associated helicase Cas3' [Candidatus Poriferisocius sp.]|uniref:CRISPR-associated helicase Cas3' n=1 Tax=Candidatus Poriferisocius sp. TaxID=3101276 RepID=UPI003B01B0AB
MKVNVYNQRSRGVAVSVLLASWPRDADWQRQTLLPPLGTVSHARLSPMSTKAAASQGAEEGAPISRNLAFDLWGKSHGLEHPYPLLGHLLDTAAASTVILDCLLPSSLSDVVISHSGGSKQDWLQATKVLAGWHDIGKASCSFQNFDPAACPSWAVGHQDLANAGRHEIVGAHLTWDRIGNHRHRYRLAQLVSGHHGVIQRLDRHYLDACGGAALVDSAPPAELIQARMEMWSALDSELGSLPDCAMPSLTASVTLSVVVLADWIASFTPFLEAQQSHLWAKSKALDCHEHYQRAVGLARDHLSDCHLGTPPPLATPSPETMFGVGRGSWRELQASIQENFSPTSPGIMFICAPTGEGKTEAALIAADTMSRASDRHGFYFAMPTVATAEGLHRRIEDYIRRSSPEGSGMADMLRRVHSQAILHDRPGVSPVSDDEDAVRASSQWMRGIRKAMLGSYGIGTIDQVLLGALKAKHSPVRMLAAALGCVIIDEAHALDPYMRRLLARTLEWLAALKTPVVVLSATMPNKRIGELVAAYQRGASGGVAPDNSFPGSGYPMWVSWSAEDGWQTSKAIEPRSRWQIRFDTENCPGSDLSERMADIAVGAANGGQCVLLVRSTVRAAQETYRAVRAKDPSLAPGESVEIIHSRMPQGVRRGRSEKLLETLGESQAGRPERLVLVATQVVEQSFDVDFDLLVTDPAPMSALLQRAGRVWRHRKTPDGAAVPVKVVWPHTPEGEPHKGSPIYSKADLMAAWACLTAENPLSVEVPDGIPDLVNRADVEGEDAFDYDSALAEEAEEATLAHLVRADQDMSQAENWAIPHPWEHDKPLHRLTGNIDTDETHPGTRHRAFSVLVIPAQPSGGSLLLRNGASIPVDPDRSPGETAIREAFDAAIPVSFPNPAWVEELPQLGNRWGRTPVGRALIGDITAGREIEAGGHTLQFDDEIGLVIAREART